MSKLFATLQALFMPQVTDTSMLFWAKEILGALLILAFFWGLAELISAVLGRWGRVLTAFTKTELDDRILKRALPHISRLMSILGLYLAIRSLPLNDKVVHILSGTLFVVLVAVFFNLLNHAFDEILQWYVSSRQEKGGAVISRQMIPIVEKLLMLFLMGTALIIILKHFNYDIFSLVTALGIGSLAIGMAAKDTMAHMISGFTLMIDRPFRIGDRIQLAGGQVGDVLDIGLRSTKIKTLDNQQMIIPNSDLCNTMLTNHAFPDMKAKGRINVGVAYGSDVELGKQVMVATALEIETVMPDPPPEAYFVAFGESSLNMCLFYWVDDYAKLFGASDRINTLIIRRFTENGIEIPFPTRTVIMEKGLD